MVLPMHCFMACDVLSDELSVEVGASYLDDVDRNRLLDDLLDLESELLDLRAALTDDGAGLCAVDEDSYLLAVALDLDLRNAGCLELLFEILSEIVVGNERVAEFFVTDVPSGIPVLYNAHT